MSNDGTDCLVTKPMMPPSEIKAEATNCRRSGEDAECQHEQRRADVAG